MSLSMEILPVTVVGAGPIGLAAASHLIDAGITPVVLEAGPAAGDNHRESSARVIDWTVPHIE